MGHRKPHRLNSPEMGDEEPRKGLSDKAQREIGKQLKALFDEVVNEPVPDRFTRLLDELDLQDRTQDPKGNKGHTEDQS